MAIAYVQSTKDTSGSFSLAFLSDNTLGNLLIVVAECATDLTSTPYTISDSNGNVWVTLPVRIFPTTYAFSQLFYALNCKAGANTVTLASGGTPGLIMIHEFSGVTTLDVKSFALGTGLSQDSGPINTNFDNELLFGYESATGTTSITPEAGWTVAESLITTGLTQYQVVSAVGTYNSLTTTTMTKAGVCNWAAEILAFYEAPMSTCDIALSVPAVRIASEAWVPVLGDGALTLPAISAALAGQEGQNAAVALTVASVAITMTGQDGNNVAVALTTPKVGLVARAQLTSEVAGLGEPEPAGGTIHVPGTTYTIPHAAREKLIIFTSGSAVAVTVPAATGAFGMGWRCELMVQGAGTVTLTPAAGTINGGSSRTVIQNRGGELRSDEPNWELTGDFN